MSEERPIDNAIPLEGDAIPEEAIPVARAVKFCRYCGQPKPPDADQCDACTTKSSTAVDLPQLLKAYNDDMHSVKSAVVLYFALLAVSAVGIIYVDLNHGKFGVIAEGVLSAAFALIASIWSIRCAALIKPALKKWFNPAWLVAGALTATLTFLLAHSLITLMVKSTGLKQIDYTAKFVREGYGFGWAVLLVCIEPAIFEELAFRGVIQTSLARAIGQREAIFVSAAMFGILHLSIPSLPHLLVMGIVLAWLRLRTGSLLPGMVLHFSHNLLVLISEYHKGFLPW